MEWIAPLLLGIVVSAALLQLFWAYAISGIARKTGQSDLMEVLAWIPLLQLAPLVAAGGSSIGRFVLGTLGLVIAILSLSGVAAVLGGGLGSLVTTLGLALASLLCVFYAAQIAWATATARGLSGWVGLLVFVPLANFFAYPYLAFHDGLIRPNRTGLILGSLLIAISAAPSLSAIRTVMETQDLSPDRLLASLAFEFSEGEVDPSIAADARSTEATRIEEESIRALYRLKSGFDALDSVAGDDDRANALGIIESIRHDLESSRRSLDASTFGELAEHLLEVEARVHATAPPPERARPRATAWGRTTSAARRTVWGEATAGPAALDSGDLRTTPSFSDTTLAPVRPYPLHATEECPADTALETHRDGDGEEEWCEQDERLGGLRHGFYARFDGEGRPESMGQYRDGLRIGIWTRFRPTGEVRAQAEFREGLQHGWVLTFDESGKRTQAVRFENGARVPSN
jgi:hypothetical protein